MWECMGIMYSDTAAAGHIGQEVFTPLAQFPCWYAQHTVLASRLRRDMCDHSHQTLSPHLSIVNEEITTYQP